MSRCSWAENTGAFFNRTEKEGCEFSHIPLLREQTKIEIAFCACCTDFGGRNRLEVAPNDQVQYNKIIIMGE